jgi:hypothetical protein
MSLFFPYINLDYLFLAYLCMVTLSVESDGHLWRF